MLWVVTRAEEAEALEKPCVIDGVTITNTGFGGWGRTRSPSALWVPVFTTDSVKETEVETAGFEAEHAQASVRSVGAR